MLLLSVITVLLGLGVYLNLAVKKRRVICNPRIGFIDLTSGEDATILEEDKRALGSLFSEALEVNASPIRCDVMFIYAKFFEDGKIKSGDVDVRQIIHDSGAKVVVIASENSQESYVHFAKFRKYGRANLVLTFLRRGRSFSDFFRELFIEMNKGTAMPTAWVKIIPQNHLADNNNLPQTMCLYELGALRFKRSCPQTGEAQ